MFSDQRSHISVLFFFFNFLFKVDLKQSLLEVNEVLIKLIFIQSPHKSLGKLSLRLVVFFKKSCKRATLVPLVLVSRLSKKLLKILEIQSVPKGPRYPKGTIRSKVFKGNLRV